MTRHMVEGPRRPPFLPLLLHCSRTLSVIASSEITVVRQKVVPFTDWRHPGFDGVRPSGKFLDNAESDSNCLRTMQFQEFTLSLDSVRNTNGALCFSTHSILLLCFSIKFYICACLDPECLLSELLGYLHRGSPLPRMKAKFLCMPRNALHDVTPSHLSSLTAHSSWWPHYGSFMVNYINMLFYFLAYCFCRHLPLCLGESSDHLLLKLQGLILILLNRGPGLVEARQVLRIQHFRALPLKVMQMAPWGTSFILPCSWPCSLMPPLMYSTSSPRTEPSSCKRYTFLYYSTYHTGLHFLRMETIPYLCGTSTKSDIAYLMNNSKMTAIIYKHLFSARHGSKCFT